MIMPIFNWTGKSYDIEIGDINDIASIEMTVLSGDEVCTVFYKDGKEKVFDSSIEAHDNRAVGYNDDIYVVFDIAEGINLLLSDDFVNRTSSYWHL